MGETDRGAVSRHAVVKAAAWSAPVIALTVAAPAASASETAALAYRLSGPTDNSGVTSWVIWITNDSSAPIAAGDLVASLPATQPDYFYSGYSGDVAWQYGPGGESVVWFYGRSLAPADEAGPIIIYLGRQGPQPAPQPTAVITFSAPGFTPVSIPLAVL